MLKIFAKTYLVSNAGFSKYYFIGIGALVVILIVAAAAIFLSPDLQKNLSIGQEEKLEKSKVAGDIIEINLDEEYFVIEDVSIGEEFKINLPEGTEIKSGGNGSGTYKLSDLELGQYIELINVKYTSSGDSGSNKKSGGSSNNGGDSNNNGGGSDNNGDNDQNEVDDWDDIFIYFPFPVISSTLLSKDSDAQTLEIEMLLAPKKKFTVIFNSDSRIASIVPQDKRSKVEFSDLQPGWVLDVFTVEDPSENQPVTALTIFVIDQ